MRYKSLEGHAAVSRAVRSKEIDISDEASRLAATILNARLAYSLERNPDENSSNHYECSVEEVK